MPNSSLSKLDKRKADAIRLAMHGRILRCPQGGNPKDCPLYEIRQLPIEERFEWLDLKVDEELQSLFLYHIKCLEKKKSADTAA